MTKPDNSQIDIRTGGCASFVGKDAVNLYRAITLKSALSTYARSGMLMTRGVSATGMLVMATQYTGKPYKRGEHQKAADELVLWIETMKSAIPTTVDGEPR